jgi:hypothetical protein
MCRAAEPSTLAAAWRRDPTEHFDFFGGVHRIDVKSSSDRKRQHHFSHAQLVPPTGTRVLIASVFVERIGSGVSLKALFDRIRDLIGDTPEALVRFDATFFATIGADWSEAMDETFDWELAVESLAFFDVAAVPKVDGALSPHVTNLHYESDLSSVPPASSEFIAEQRGLFAACQPQD